MASINYLKYNDDSLAFFFISLEPNPPIFMRSLMFESRVGVDGFSMWKGALHGKRFQIATEVDCFDLVAANAVIESYHFAQQAALPMEIAWASIEKGFDVVIENVDADARAILHGQGGLCININGVRLFGFPSRAVVTATWSLIAWPKP